MDNLWRSNERRMNETYVEVNNVTKEMKRLILKRMEKRVILWIWCRGENSRWRHLRVLIVFGLYEPCLTFILSCFAVELFLEIKRFVLI